MYRAEEPTRYTVSQLSEALGRARGDGRWEILQALLLLPDGLQTGVLTEILEYELDPEQRVLVLAALARLEPEAYVRQLIEFGLRSRSLNAQLNAAGQFRSCIVDPIPGDLTELVEGWIRRPIKGRKPTSSWSMGEVPGAMLALLPSYGIARTLTLLAELEPRMHPEERRWWRRGKKAATSDDAFREALVEWSLENVLEAPDPYPRDPTADGFVNRAKRRLGYQPANPNSDVWTGSIYG